MLLKFTPNNSTNYERKAATKKAAFCFLAGVLRHLELKYTVASNLFYLKIPKNKY
jgi:hypothetical protein